MRASQHQSLSEKGKDFMPGRMIVEMDAQYRQKADDSLSAHDSIQKACQMLPKRRFIL